MMMVVKKSSSIGVIVAVIERNRSWSWGVMVVVRGRRVVPMMMMRRNWRVTLYKRGVPRCGHGAQSCHCEQKNKQMTHNHGSHGYALGVKREGLK